MPFSTRRPILQSTAPTMMRVTTKTLRLLVAAIAAFVAALCASAALATDVPAEQNVLTCRIDGQDRAVSVSIAGDSAVYRFGADLQKPELTLRRPLADLDYRRNSGAGDTIDEIVTFPNGDTAYRIAAGFRNGAAPDPSALQPFALLTVSRAGKPLATLACRPDSIVRVHDRLLAAMRGIGRERASDGETFSNYTIQYPAPAGQSPPCAADFSVDTCWSRGVSAARGGDLRGAIGHFDMSCTAGLTDLGCYEAGKLYLQNRQLRDYALARARFTRVCDGDDPGRGPYACKYLGWMYLTATGVPRDIDKAWSSLARACFLHNDVDMIDPEGCHHLAAAVSAARAVSPTRYAHADFVAYVALSQGCTDNARTVCDEARALYRTGAARGASWIKACDAAVRTRGTFPSCEDMARSRDDHDAAMATRRKLKATFLTALDDVG